MRPQPKDVRGTELRPGQKCAYNMSGDLALGKILDVQHGHVKILRLAGGFEKLGHISKVKNRRSIMVLRPEDCV
jgi:hypothetical protein